MLSEAITYQSPHFNLSGKSTLENKTNKGITCSWTAETTDKNTNIKNQWNFNWDKLKKEGVEELTGYIIIKRVNPNESAKFKVLLTSAEQVVERTMKTVHGSWPTVQFEYSFTPIFIQQIDELPYEVMFLKSDQTDAILVVDGKKLHVNKAFLSFHSDFFRALFTSNFEEKNMKEIPISDVTYEDFARLLSMVYPQNSFPNDNNVEKLLKLADRFIMPCAIRSIEHHLLNSSKFENPKLISLADKYSMPTLLKRAIRLMNTVEKAEIIETSTEYNELSAETKAALFKRILQFV